MISKEELEKWAFQLNMDGDCDATDKDIETLITQALATMEELETAKRCLPVDKEFEVRGSWIGSVQNYIVHLEESLENASVGNALLERENHHAEVVGHLVDLIIELKAKLSESSESESDRNPVLACADSYRDMAKQGVESVPIWSVITDLERNIAPLYRHAQPAPVVPDEVLKSLGLLFHRSYFRRWVKDPQGYVSGSIPVCDLVNVVLFAEACRAAMLTATPQESKK